MCPHQEASRSVENPEPVSAPSPEGIASSADSEAEGTSIFGKQQQDNFLRGAIQRDLEKALAGVADIFSEALPGPAPLSNSNGRPIQNENLLVLDPTPIEFVPVLCEERTESFQTQPVDSPLNSKPNSKETRQMSENETQPGEERKETEDPKPENPKSSTTSAGLRDMRRRPHIVMHISYLRVEGPQIKDKAHAQVSATRSYGDLLDYSFGCLVCRAYGSFVFDQQARDKLRLVTMTSSGFGTVRHSRGINL